MTDGRGISCEIALLWMSMDLTDDKSTLVQVMKWCRQASSHYLSKCWPRSLSPYSVTRTQWVNGSVLHALIENTYWLSINSENMPMTSHRSGDMEARWGHNWLDEISAYKVIITAKTNNYFFDEVYVHNKPSKILFFPMLTSTHRYSCEYIIE